MEILTLLARLRANGLLTQVARIVLSCLCGVSFSGAALAADGSSLEYPVKAAYLYKFGIYVQWPSAAFETPSSPLNVCVLGEDPFGSLLDEAVNGQLVERHPIQVRRLRTYARDADCHILYLGTMDPVRAAPALETARGHGVLTVSEAPGLGVISFVTRDNRVRFTIDEEAAAQSGLVISSKLLGIAISVKPRQQKEVR